MSDHLKVVSQETPARKVEWWETATWYPRWKAVHAQRGEKPHPDDMQVLLADSEQAAWLVVTTHQEMLADRASTKAMTEILDAGIAHDWRRGCALAESAESASEVA